METYSPTTIRKLLRNQLPMVEEHVVSLQHSFAIGEKRQQTFRTGSEDRFVLKCWN